MLKKLFRQEMKVQGKAIAGVYGVMLSATALMAVLALIGQHFPNKVIGAVCIVGGMLYVLTMVVVFVATFIYLCSHFYKSMYSAQGYLTHTLPAKASQILNVKIAVSWAYLCLTGVMELISVLAVGMIKSGIGAAAFFQQILQLFQSMADEMGVSGLLLAMVLFFLFVFGFLASLLLFFAGSSIGQLFNRSKAACGIAASVALYYLSQIASVIVAAVSAWLFLAKAGMDVVSKCFLAVSPLGLFFWAAIYYMISRHIVQNHLNLE